MRKATSKEVGAGGRFGIFLDSDALKHHNTKQEFMVSIDNRKVHLKTVSQLEYKKFLCLDET